MSLRKLAVWLRAWSIPAVVFLLPWQVVWVLRVEEVGGYGWDLATVRLFGVPLLILVAAALHWRLVVAAVRKAWAASLGLLGVLVLWVALAGDQVLALQHAGQLISATLLFVLLVIVAASDSDGSEEQKRSLKGSSEPRFKERFCSSSKDRIAWIFLITMCIQAVLALIQFGVQEVWGSVLLGVAAHTPGELGVPVVEALSGRYLRAYGTLPHPNILGAWLSVSSFLAFLVALRAEGSKRIVSSGVFALLLVGLLVTFSRSAWLALALAGFTWIILSIRARNLPQWNAWVGPVLAGGAVVLLLFTAFRPMLQTRVGFDSRLEEQSVNERVETLQHGWELFKQKPVFGYGMGNATVVLHDWKPDLPGYLLQPPHFVGLLVLVEVGVIGTLLLVGGVIWSLRLVYREIGMSLPVLVAVVVLLGTVSLFDHFLWTLWPGVALGAFAMALPLYTHFGKKRS